MIVRGTAPGPVNPRQAFEDMKASIDVATRSSNPATAYVYDVAKNRTTGQTLGRNEYERVFCVEIHSSGFKNVPGDAAALQAHRSDHTAAKCRTIVADVNAALTGTKNGVGNSGGVPYARVYGAILSRAAAKFDSIAPEFKDDHIYKFLYGYTSKGVVKDTDKILFFVNREGAGPTPPAPMFQCRIGNFTGFSKKRCTYLFDDHMGYPDGTLARDLTKPTGLALKIPAAKSSVDKVFGYIGADNKVKCISSLP